MKEIKTYFEKIKLGTFLFTMGFDEDTKVIIFNHYLEEIIIVDGKAWVLEEYPSYMLDENIASFSIDVKENKPILKIYLNIE